MKSSKCSRIPHLEPTPLFPVAQASRLCPHRRDGGATGCWNGFWTLAILLASLHPAIALADPPEDQNSTAARQTRRLTPAVKVFKEASPAVVSLSTTTIVTVRDSFGFGGIFDDIFDFPMSRPRQYEAHNIGSGFVIHSDGYVVTNAHVVDRAGECKITFANGAELPAVKVAVEHADDLAILKIDAEHPTGKKTAAPPFPAVKLGRSDDLMPGETVIAIGNPLGYQHTVTTGVISAINRELRFGESVKYSGLIQIDASINPGNSGGPLLNVLGELIGINTAIRGDAQNIGFAIPVDRLHALLPEMLDVERLRRAKLGIHFDGQPTSPKPAGVRIRKVDTDSQAAKAGVRPDDLVAAINGTPTPDFLDAFSVLDSAPLGKEVALELVRDGSERKTVRLPLEEIPKLDGGTVMWERFGIRVRELSRADMSRLGIRQPIALLVVEVDPRSQAAQEGVSPDDLITRFGGRPVTSLDALGNLLEQVKPGDRIPVGVWRIAESAIVQVELPLKAR